MAFAASACDSNADKSLTLWVTMISDTASERFNLTRESTRSTMPAPEPITCHSSSMITWKVRRGPRPASARTCAASTAPNPSPQHTNSSAALSLRSFFGTRETSMHTAGEDGSIGSVVWPLRTLPSRPEVSARRERHSSAADARYSSTVRAAVSSHSSSLPSRISVYKFSRIGGRWPVNPWPP